MNKNKGNRIRREAASKIIHLIIILESGHLIILEFLRGKNIDRLNKY